MTLPKTGRRKSGDKAWLTSQSRRLRPSYRPVLESLEERVVPTTLSIPTNLTGARGSIVTVPINVDVLQDQATGFAGFGYGDFVLAYDTSVFTVANTDVHLGSVDPQASGFSVQSNAQNTGLLLIGVVGSGVQTSTAGGSVVTVDFHVKATAPMGPTVINLRATSPIGSTPTHVGDPHINDYDLTPPPQDVAGDPGDGLVTIGVFNHAPLAVNDTYTVTEREAADAANLVVSAPGVLANDTDQDGDALSAVKLSDPAHGTVSFQSNGSFTYSSAAGYVGPDSFTYVAFDGADTSNTVTIALSVTPRLSIPTDLTAVAGGTVVVPVNINDAFPAGSGGLTGVTVAINYDPTVFTVASPDVVLGTATSKTNAVQTISFGGTVGGGSFTLTLNNGGTIATTSPITYSSSQAALQGNIQTAINGLSNMISGNAVVGTGPANTFTVTFQGNPVSGRNIATMTANPSLTGTNPSVAVATTTNGFAAWVLGATINQGLGKMGISLTGQSGINANPGGGSLVLITFHVNTNAPSGPSPINLMATNVPSATSVTTRLDAQSGQLSLRPFVTDGLDLFVDGVVNIGASATHFSITGAPSGTTAGGFANFTVTALDGANNAVSGYTGTVHFSSSDALAGLPANATLTSGAGTFSVTLKTAGNQTVTASDVANSSITGSSGTIAVVAAQATHFTATASPVSTTVGGTTAVTVTALDSFNNTATGYSGTVHFASTDSVAALPADSTLTSGAGIFSVTLKTFGSNTVSATDSVNSTLTATSNTVIVAGPPATHFSITASPPVVTAGGAISITVTALDAGNNLTNGYLGTIHFTSNDSLAGLPANATLTSGAGTFSVTLKTAGSRTLTATDTVASTITATSNSITVIAGAATNFAVVAPNTATAGNAFSFTVTAQDAFNNTAAGYNGTVKITATDTQIAQPVIVVLTGGTGTFSATLRTAGSQSLTATDSVTSTLSGISNAIVVTPVAATRIIANGPISGLANNPFNVVVTALDPYNNTATSYQGTIHFTTSDSQGVLPTDGTLTNGQGTFTLTLKTLGAQTVTAADTVATSFSNTFTYTVFNDNTVGHFSVTPSPSGVTAGGTVSLTVTALDGFAQIVTGFTGTVHFTSTDGQALLPADATLTSGVGTFTATLNSPGNQTVMAATTTPIGVFPADKILVHKQGQTPFQIPLTNDSLMSRLDATPGPTPGSYYIGIDDDHTSTGSFDNDILILVQPMPDGSLNLTTVHKENDVGGQHTYDLLNSAGTTLVTDFEPGPNQLYTLPPAFISGTSAAIQVGPAPFHYVLSAPANVIAGAAFSFSVTAFDASNNTLTGYNGTVHFSSTDGQATLPANATLTSGQGAFIVTLKSAGSRTLTATDTSSSSITASSNSISVNAAAANHFAANGSPNSVTTGGTVNFTVTALDQFNNTATAYNGTVGFTSTDSAATMPANSTLTSGLGAFSVTLKTAGNRTLTVTDTANSTIVGASNTIIVATPAATHFVVTTPAVVSAGASFSFTITALDAGNNTVPGYTGTIKFTSTDSAATMPANATLTSGSGTFTLTLKTAGTRTLTATDAANSSIFGTSNSITVVPGAATHFALSAPASAISGAAFNFTVNALDANNNTATGYGGSVRFTSSDGQAVLPANATLTSGQGAFTVTLKSSGSQTVTVTDTGNGTITGSSTAITVTDPNSEVEPNNTLPTSNGLIIIPGNPLHAVGSIAGTVSNSSDLDYFNLGYLRAGDVIDLAAMLPAGSTLDPRVQIVRGSTNATVASGVGTGHVMFVVPVDDAYYALVSANTAASAGNQAQYVLNVDLTLNTPPTVVATTLPFNSSSPALTFNGINQFAQIPAAPVMNSLPLTLEAWVRPDLRNDGTDFPNNVISNDNPNQYGHGFGVNVWSGGSQFKIDYQDGLHVVPGVSFSAGTWYHVAVVYTSGNVKAYVNGVLVDSFSYSQGGLDGLSVINIGMCNADPQLGTGGFFKGAIDEVRIWNVARSQSQLQAAMNSILDPSANPNLVANWRFQEGTGLTTADATANHYNGNLGDNSLSAATPAWSSAGAPGLGGALQFDGVNDFAPAYNAPVMNSLPLTLEAWVRPDLRSDGTDFFSNVISNDNPNHYGHGFGVNVWAAGSQLKLEYQDGFRVVPGVSFTAGTWYHVAVVYSNGNVTSYVNGALVDSFSYSQGALDGSTSIVIGKHNDATELGTARFFKGAIDEVRVWNVARTQSQIQAAFNSVLDPSLNPNLVGYWRFEEGAGSVSADATANHFVVTFGNAPIWTTDGAASFNAVGVVTSPAAFNNFSITLSQDLLASSANSAANYSFVGAGADGTFGTGDDTAYPVTASYVTGSRTVNIAVNTTPSPQRIYRFQTLAGLTDRAGNSVTPFSRTFVTAFPATHFAVSAPTAATQGNSFTVTVTALDSNNNLANAYVGTVRVSTSDGQAVLPANATLTSGVGIFSVTLKSAGNQTVTASDATTSSIAGISNVIAVASAGTAEIHGTTFNDTNRNGVRDTGPQNYVVNGNFSAGNTGFRSDYTYNATDVTGSPVYVVGDNPSHFSPYTASFPDHTTGSGLMMILNGGTSASQVIWDETVTVPANTTFTLSAFAASTYASAVANLKFVINGQQVGSNFTLSATTGQFQQFSSTWNSLSSTTAIIDIYDLQTAVSGNDFTLDDISLTAPAPSEPGLPGWVMYLDQNTNNTRDPSEPFTTTDSQGGYAFTGLAAGSYVVAEEGQTGWTPTNPAGGRQTVTLTNGQVLTGADFGDTTVATHFVISGAPATISPNSPFSFTVTALDQFNNTATNYTGTVHFSSSDSLAVLPVNGTLTSGTGTFAITLKSLGNQTITASDSVTSSIAGSATVTVSTLNVSRFQVSTNVAPNPTFNGGFETPATSAGGFATLSAGSTSMAPWVINSGSVDVVNNGYWPAYEGANSLNLAGNSPGTISQVFATTPGASYLLTFAYGNNADQSFTATGTVKVTGAVTLLNSSVSHTGSATANMHYTVFSAMFTADSTSANLQFQDTTNNGAYGLVLDGVTITSAPSAGTSIAVTVTAMDTSNNTATGYGGTVHFTSSDVQAVLPANATLTNGSGTFNVVLKTAGNDTITAADAGNAAIAGSTTVSIRAAAATHFSVSAPSVMTAGSNTSVTVTALDQFNNTATSYSGTVHLSSTDAQATLAPNAQLISGVGTFNVTLQTPGNQTLTATDTAASAITGTSATINVASGPATQINLASSSNPAIYGQGVTLTATVSSSPALAAGLGVSYYNLNVSNTSVSAAFLLPAGTPTAAATLVARRIDSQVNIPNNNLGFFPPNPVSGLNTTNVAAQWSGLVQIVTGGTYTFFSPSDDGSALYVDGNLVVNNGTSTNIALSAGYHSFMELYIQAGGAAAVEVDYQGPDSGNTRRIIPSSAFFHAPTGVVTFFDSGTQIGTGILVSQSSSATATFSTSNFVVGTHPITAGYTGDGYFAASSTATAFNQVVNSAPTSTAVVTSPNPSAVGEAVMFTATVTATGNAQPGLTASYYSLGGVPSAVSDAFSLPAGTPTANATFVASRTETQINIPTNSAGFVPAVAVPGLAATNMAVKWSGLIKINQGGAYTFYSPSDDGSLLYVDGALVVNNDGNHSYQEGTSTAITLSAGTHSFLEFFVQGGGPAGIVVDYQGPDSGNTRQTIPATAFTGILSGSVQFAVDGANFGSPVTLSSGTASVTDSALTVGSHAITAIYIGTGNFQTSNNNVSPVSQSVVQPHYVFTAPTVANVNGPYSFTITALSPSNAVATGYNGSIHFTSSDGQAVLPANATLTNGIGTFLATLKTPGNQTLTATDAVVSSVTATSGSILVANAATHFAVSAPANATIGSAVTLTVTALDANNHPAVGYNGTVAFSSSDSSATLPPYSLGGDILLNDGSRPGHIFEVTASGALVKTVDIPASGDGSPRGITVDKNGNAAIYNGDFNPSLSTVSLTTGAALSTIPFGGGGSYSVSFYGGVAAFGNYVFASSMTTGGLIRFNDSDHSIVRFATDKGYISVSMGLDGLIYACGGFNGINTEFYVYDPTTLAFIRRIDLHGGGSWAAVDKDGTFYSVSVNSNAIYVFSSNGTLLQTVPTPLSGIGDIALDGNGRIVASSLNTVLVTDKSFSTFTTFTSPDGGGAFVAWDVLPLGIPLNLTNGVGTFTATLNTNGLQTITATDTANSTATGTSNVIATSNPTTHFVLSTPTNVSAGSSFNVTVTALDQSNNTAIGYGGAVHFSTSDGQALLPANATLTNGIGTFTFTLKTAGSQSLIIADTVSTTITGAANFITVSPLAASKFSVSAPVSAQISSAFNITVTARDQYDNPITSYSGSVQFASTDGQAMLPSVSTLSSGSRVFAVTLKTAGTQTISVADMVNSAMAGVSNAISVSSVATHFAISAPVGATTNASFNITVTALDAANLTAGSYGGTVRFTSSDAQAVLPANATLTNGVGTFNVTLKTSGSRTVSATDTANANITGVSNAIAMSGPATHFTVNVPSAPMAGLPFTFTVAALDASNNTATGYSGSVRFGSSDTQAVLPPNATLTGGAGTFSATFKTTGSQTLTVAGATSGTPSFTTATGSPFNSPFPKIVASGDFNNDGKLDLAVASDYYGNVTVFLGNGNGSFGAGAQYGGGANIQAITVGDVNGDGKPDIAVANYDSNSVGVLLGVGDGTFAAMTNFPVSNSANGVLILDVNNDSKQDLIVASGGNTGTYVSILLGNGNGTFGAATNYTVGANPSSIVSADFNHDGKLDLATSNSNGNNLSVLFGTGAGAFGTPTNYALGTYPYRQALGDFNGDGNPDIAVTNYQSNTISILLGQSNGVFSAPTTIAVGTRPFDVKTADLNADGRLDLVVTNQNSSSYSILMGNGNGTFAAPQNSGMGQPTGLSIADFNRDGFLDLAMVNYSSSVSIALQQVLTGSATVTVSLPPTHYSITTPANAAVGNSFSVTVSALNASNAVTTSYTGTVQFTSSDGTALLPANTTLTNGVGTFTVTLKTLGSQTVTATDTAASITGSSSTITVGPAATHFAVTAAATVTAGASSTFTVAALDAGNNTVPGYTGTVHFSSSDGQAALPANAVLVNGVQTFSLTLKTAGSQTLSVADANVSTIAVASATVLVNAASANHFAVGAPAMTTAGVANSILVTALDPFNNTAGSYAATVHFTSTDVQAALPPDATLTSGSGTFNLTLKSAGNKTLTVADTAAAVPAVSSIITVNPAAFTHFAVTSPTTVTTGVAFSDTVVAQDDFNNTVTSYAGTVQLSSSDSQAALPSGNTLTSGAGAFSITLNSAGGQTLTATDTASALSGASATIAVYNPATHFAVTAPTGATAGSSFSFTVTALDVNNAPTPAYAGTVSFSSVDSLALLPANATLTSGAGTFTATLKTAATQTLTVTDRAISTIAGTSGAIAVNAAAVTHFTVTGNPSTLSAGTAFNITVTALDQFNNTATAYTGAVRFTSNDTQAALPANSTLTSGAGAFSVTFKTVGNRTVTATELGGSSSGTSSTSAVSPAAAARFTVSGLPANPTAGNGFNMTVRAIDAFNNTVTNYTGSVHFTSSDPLAVLQADKTLTSGQGTFGVTLKTAGSQTLNAADAANTVVAGSGTTTVNAAAATRFTVSAPALAGAGSTFSVTVTARDTFGNIAANYIGTVRFTKTDSGAGAAVPTNYAFVSGDHGVHTFTNGFTLVSAGTQTITATDTATSSISGAAMVNVGVTLSIPSNLTGGRGNITTVPLNVNLLSDPVNGNAGLSGGDFIVYYDPSLFTVADSDVHLGSILTPASAWGLLANTSLPGQIVIGLSGSGTNNTTVGGSLVTVDFHVKSTAPIGAVSALDLAADLSGGLPLTHVADQNAQDYVLTPPPLDGPDPNDGSISIVNQAPIAAGDLYAVTERAVAGDPILVVASTGVLANDTDPDGQPITASKVSNPGHGTLAFNSDGSFTYTPDLGYQGADSFSYKASDGSLFSNTVTVNLNVTPRLSIPTNLSGIPGGTVVVPVIIDNPNPNGSGGLDAATLAVNFDPSVFTVDSGDVQTGTVTNNWLLTTDINAASGQIGIHLSSATPNTSVSAGSLAFITLHIKASTPGGNTAINLAATNAANGGTVTTSLHTTLGGLLDLRPAVTNTANDVGVDGAVTIVGATHFVISAPASATAGSTFSVTVTALDQFNATAAGYGGTVHFTSNDSQVSMPADATLTSGAGTFNASLKTVGTRTITATDTVNGVTGVCGGIAVSAAAATHFAVIAPASVTFGSAFNFTLVAKDQFNNTAAGYGGTIHFTSGDSQASLPADAVLSGGTATLSATLNSSGSQTLTATDTAATSISGTSNNISPAATHFVISVPTATTAGDAFVVMVSAQDQFNSTTTGYAGTVHFSSSDAKAGLPADLTLNNGLGFFATILKTAGNQSLTAIDKVNSALSGTTNAIVVSPAAVNHFGFTVPATAATGVPFSFTITALDPFNNVLTGYAGAVHFMSNDGAATVPADAMLISGAGTFSATLRTVGSQLLLATDTITTSITGASSLITTRGLLVSAVTPTPLGFVASFNKPFDPSVVNLYDGVGTYGTSDVTVTGPSGLVRGSLLLDPSNASFTFIKTGVGTNGLFAGVLAAGNYTVTFRSAANGFKDSDGGLLDGNGDGVSGDNYLTTFTVGASSQPVLSIPDFARGPNGAVSIKVPQLNGSGIPITLTNAAGVTDVTFMLNYNPAMLNITSTLSNTSGTFMLVGTPSGGVANFSFHSSTAINGNVTLGQIVAQVPDSAATSYKAKELLHLSNIALNGSSNTSAINDDGVHVTAYPGDVSGDGLISPLDASLTSRVATIFDTGFAAYRLADPAIVGDLNGNSFTDSSDVTLINRTLAGITVAQLPPLPTGLTIVPTGPDPTLSLPTGLTAAPGETVVVPVHLDTARPEGSTGLMEAVLALRYDPKVFTVSASDVQLGTLPASGSGWKLQAVVNVQTGEIGIDLFSATPIVSANGGSLVTLTLHVLADAPAGASGINLVRAVNPTGQRTFVTTASDAAGPYILHPAVTDGVSDAGVDGRVSVPLATIMEAASAPQPFFVAAARAVVEAATEPAGVLTSGHELALGLMERIFGDLESANLLLRDSLLVQPGAVLETELTGKNSDAQDLALTQALDGAAAEWVPEDYLAYFGQKARRDVKASVLDLLQGKEAANANGVAEFFAREGTLAQ